MSARILVVEDVIVNRALLVAMLEGEGYEVVEATDASEALGLLRRESVDIVLLDVMLPGSMDGFAVCRWIKSHADYADLPVIFITGLDDTASKVQGLELGAADYVTKPFKREEILARVRTQLRIRQLTQSLTDANRELIDKQEQLEEDLRSAALVQQAFLPHPELAIPRFGVGWRFTPSLHIGGDLFNVTPIGNGWWAAYLVDVSGHGVPPALVTVAVAQTILQELHTALVQESSRVPSPSDVIRTLEAHFPMNRFDRYFTIVLVMIDSNSGRLVYSSAGHPPPVLVTAAGTELLEAGGPPVGMGYRSGDDEGTRDLSAGDRVFLYTDGLIDQTDRHGEPFGLDRLQLAGRAAHDLPLEAACDNLIAELDQFRGEVELDDDLAFLALQYH